MRCLECGGAVRITTTLAVRHYPDNRWDIETPFQFQPNDPVECINCNWSGQYRDLQAT
jgi:hypothetical protein